ncbi:ParB/RepB/Spo0J family partition protein [Ponticoccus alexandrii]|uniref:ParB N-terminal domain-containing protein n=1 Tax=Ponticoccus alexandrii TaxID=1943633 RepID=A0ABX7FES0_9RHOB|nr:ParB N-terminal domain-containing protein [Ponticoccus alexandrii]ETA50648.1 replication protein [Rhodobacteraceae bacterium PD-2]QRF68621.1 ParB N-terminal domain-containing protein [Ponticoccus alexandrii]
MSRKRRIFDITLPEDDEAVQPSDQPGDMPDPTGEAGMRRGPMASAIAENAEAVKARRTAVESIRAENDALAHEYVALREAGHVVSAVLLAEVHTSMLVRDRMPGDDPELVDLVASIRDLGLSNPIRILPRPDGGFELVQGYRRLSAYRMLLEETGDDAWSRIPALVLPGEPDISSLYRRMVDENVIRKNLSFAEMAYAARNYAADPATDADDVAAAVAALFQSAPYSKRSYIRSFSMLLDSLSDVLAFPTEIPRALGVTLARQIKDRPEVASQIRDALMGWSDRSAEDELGVLRRYADGEEPHKPLPATAPASAERPLRGGRTKTTFHIQSSAGQVKCTAGPGRLEIKVERDFSSIERARLERAIASLIDGLA